MPGKEERLHFASFIMCQLLPDGSDALIVSKSSSLSLSLSRTSLLVADLCDFQFGVAWGDLLLVVNKYSPSQA